ncbi:hypothetical protein [Methylococcus mesophilus]|uniref:hypothetical protein n=1 Tax=Methylococcus mesophilus TaxID=2993564 RepID=UPI00224B8E28|nr:hypothetical protein [Methylococcus mesophilus]UZR27345.1 hypothetical protein OOT43_11420 [Methylococcus mesophilus]
MTELSAQEKLDRYFTTLKRFDELLVKRHALGVELTRMINRTLDTIQHSQYVVLLFKHKEARMLLEEIIELNGDLIKTTEKLNKEAAACGKRGVAIYEQKE